MDLARPYVRRLSKWLHTPLGSVVLFGVLFLVSCYFFYRRFPNNFTSPNFYAEDGTIYTFFTLHKGVWNATFTTFNGYFVCGLYILTGLGFLYNHLHYGGELVTLPQSLALMSYALMALVATLPILLLRKYVPMLWLVALALLVTFVPMPGSDYAILGTIGNLKFVFLYVAVLLLVYRHYAPAKSPTIWWCDAALLLCAYTDITVYALMPFALVRYLPLVSKDIKATIGRLLRDRSFLSFIALGLLLIPQLIVIKTHGIPKLPGYLDTPFQPQRGIEIFVWRTYLYGFFYTMTKMFNDTATIVVMAVALLALFWRAKQLKYLYVAILGLYAAFMGTYLFAANRTGISSTFFGYKAGGPDQFFYTQNMIVTLIVVFALSRATARLKPLVRAGFVVAFVVLCLAPAPHASTYGTNNFMADDVGTAVNTMKDACLHETGDDLTSTIYPNINLKFHGTREELCTKRVQAHVLQHALSLGIEPSGNGLIPYPGSTTQFTQTFVSPQDGLDGINLFIADYTKTPSSNFKLTLYDETCSRKVTQATIVGNTVRDNMLHQVIFDQQKDSAGRSYCFTVGPVSKDGVSPIALHLSAPGIYPLGQATVNGQPIAQDVVFSLLYGEK